MNQNRRDREYQSQDFDPACGRQFDPRGDLSVRDSQWENIRRLIPSAEDSIQENIVNRRMTMNESETPPNMLGRRMYDPVADRSNVNQECALPQGPKTPPPAPSPCRPAAPEAIPFGARAFNLHLEREGCPNPYEGHFNRRNNSSNDSSSFGQSYNGAGAVCGAPCAGGNSSTFNSSDEFQGQAVNPFAAASPSRSGGAQGGLYARMLQGSATSGQASSVQCGRANTMASMDPNNIVWHSIPGNQSACTPGYDSTLDQLAPHIGSPIATSTPGRNPRQRQQSSRSPTVSKQSSAALAYNSSPQYLNEDPEDALVKFPFLNPDYIASFSPYNFLAENVMEQMRPPEAYAPHANISRPPAHISRPQAQQCLNSRWQAPRPTGNNVPVNASSPNNMQRRSPSPNQNVASCGCSGNQSARQASAQGGQNSQFQAWQDSYDADCSTPAQPGPRGGAQLRPPSGGRGGGAGGFQIYTSPRGTSFSPQASSTPVAAGGGFQIFNDSQYCTPPRQQQGAQGGAGFQVWNDSKENRPPSGSLADACCTPGGAQGGAAGGRFQVYNDSGKENQTPSWAAGAQGGAAGGRVQVYNDSCKENQTPSWAAGAQGSAAGGKFQIFNDSQYFTPPRAQQGAQGGAGFQVYNDSCKENQTPSWAGGAQGGAAGGKFQVYNDSCKENQPPSWAQGSSGARGRRSPSPDMSISCNSMDISGSFKINRPSTAAGRGMGQRGRSPQGYGDMSLTGNEMSPSDSFKVSRVPMGGKEPKKSESMRELCNRKEKQKQIENLVKDRGTPGIIQDTLDGCENFNCVSMDLTLGQDTPDERPQVEPLTIVEAFHLRIMLARNEIGCVKDNSKVSSDSESGDQKKKEKSFVDSYFAEQADSEINRVIAAYLKAEKIEEITNEAQPQFTPEISKKVTTLPGSELNNFEDLSMITYTSTTQPA